MLRRSVFALAVALSLSLSSGVARADDAGAIEDAGRTEAAPQRPPPGPAIRERGARRSRGGSAASGALMIAVIVGAIVYYVVKRIRRF